MKYLLFALLFIATCAPRNTQQTKSSQMIKGDPGSPGLSAYQIWLKNGYSGSEKDFLNWLREGNKSSPETGADKTNVTAALRDNGSERKFSDITGYIPITELGCKGDQSNDCGKILSDYIASKPINSAINLFIPPGAYYFASTLKIVDRLVNIRGAGHGASMIYVAPGKDGIFVDRKKGIFFDYILEDFAILAYGKTTPASGIRLWQRGIVRRVEVQGFSQRGIWIDGYAVGKPEDDAAHNAAFTKIEDCNIVNNGEEGILIDGSDGNACITFGNDIRNNGGWGIRESSFLGGLHIGNMFHSNKKGAYTVDHQTAITNIIGGYVEGDQPPSLLWKNTVTVIGKGSHYADIKYHD